MYLRQVKLQYVSSLIYFVNALGLYVYRNYLLRILFFQLMFEIIAKDIFLGHIVGYSLHTIVFHLAHMGAPRQFNLLEDSYFQKLYKRMQKYIRALQI